MAESSAELAQMLAVIRDHPSKKLSARPMNKSQKTKNYRQQGR